MVVMRSYVSVQCAVGVELGHHRLTVMRLGLAMSRTETNLFIKSLLLIYDELKRLYVIKRLNSQSTKLLNDDLLVMSNGLKLLYSLYESFLTSLSALLIHL